jgi:hypothetical protein
MNISKVDEPNPKKFNELNQHNHQNFEEKPKNHLWAGMRSLNEPVQRRARGLLNSTEKVTSMAEIIHMSQELLI